MANLRNNKQSQKVNMVLIEIVRTKKAKNLLDISRQTGFTSHQLYQIRAFNLKPTLVLLESLHKTFNVNMNYIFGKSEDVFLKSPHNGISKQK